MIKPRKNISLDLKTYEKLRKSAFKKGIPIARLIADLLEPHPIIIRSNIVRTEDASGADGRINLS